MDRHFEHIIYSDNYTTNSFQDLHKKIKTSLDNKKKINHFFLSWLKLQKNYMDLSMNLKIKEVEVVIKQNLNRSPTTRLRIKIRAIPRITNKPLNR